MNHLTFSSTCDRCLLWTSTLGLNWLLMQVVHEFGHICGAWGTGGKIVMIDLFPLRISHTFVQPNPMPIIVIWSGPMIGILLPLAAWLIARFWRLRVCHHFRFFAGFCLVANGAYLGSAAFLPVGDARDLMHLGVSPVNLLLFAVICLPAGFLLWNGLGPAFGLGPNAHPISRREALGMLLGLVLLLTVEFLLFA